MHVGCEAVTAPCTWVFARLIAQPADLKELFLGKPQAEAVSYDKPRGTRNGTFSMHVGCEAVTAPCTWVFVRLIAQPADLKELFVGKPQAEAASYKEPIAARIRWFASRFCLGAYGLIPKPRTNRK